MRLITTDFDGTCYRDTEQPPVPVHLQELIRRLQDRGAWWVINTGRDLPSILDALAQAQLRIQPDFLVVVEREIYRRNHAGYLGWEAWNKRCHLDHAHLFAQVEPFLPELVARIRDYFGATVFADAYSPLCLIAANNQDADVIMEHLQAFCERFPPLTVMRNDVYARFSHGQYHKGTAMAEIARVLGLPREQVFAAGDHFNDLPMLSRDYAEYLVAPANAIPAVKDAVRQQSGFVSEQPFGYGLASGLEHYLRILSSLPA